MCHEPSAQVSKILLNWGQGNQQARKALVPLVYDELRPVARHYLRRERPDLTLQGATLVHEAYLRLIHQDPRRWQNSKREWATARAWLQRQIKDKDART